MMMIGKEKRCFKCGETKSLEEFHNNKSRKDGKAPACKLCAKQYKKQWRENNPEYNKQYYEDNVEKIAQKGKQWREDNSMAHKQQRAKYRKRIRSEGTACVYELFFKEDVKYIGETLCLENRKKDHHKQLVASYSHKNKNLQEEFDKHNLSRDDVTFKKLVEFNKGDYESEELLREALRTEEARQIALHRERGIALCN
jgi:hypothetical protein